MTKKKKIKKKDLEILITSLKPNNNLYKTLNSIISQRVQGLKVIVSYPLQFKDLEFEDKYKHKVKFVNAKKSNQIHQRNLGIKKIKNKKIILNLDDSIILKKNCLKELLNIWSDNYHKDIVGIGLNPVGQRKPKANIFQKLSLTNSDHEGIILPSGYAIGWNQQSKNYYTEWLNGGMTSWNLKKVMFIKNRKFPMVKWCVSEDVIFSFLNSKKKKLLISSKAKAKILDKENKFNSLSSSFYHGYMHSKMTHSFKRFLDKKKYYLYFYATISSSIFGIIKSLIKLNIKEIARFIGRFIGIFTFFPKSNFL